MEKARVLLAAPHRLVREALGRAIDQEENITLVGLTDDSLEAYRLAREHRPDVILFDLDSSRMDWANFVRELSVSCRGVRFLALSPDGDIQRISSLCEAGIHGCVCFRPPFPKGWSGDFARYSMEISFLTRGYPMACLKFSAGSTKERSFSGD